MSRRFVTLESAMDYIESLPEEMQSTAEICQLPLAEDSNITDEEHVDEDNLDEVIPEDVCGELSVTVMHEDYESDSESIDTLPVEKTSWKRRTCFTSDLGDEKPLALHETASELISLSPTELFHKILPVEKIEDKIPMPNIVKNYNESMGGVDTMDKLLSSYKPKMRSRKWWWNLFNNALNIAVVAAWRLHCELHATDRSAMTHLAFRRDITAHLLRARPLQISRPGPRIHLPHSLRSSRGHFLQSSTQGRCAVCKKKL
ncbi:PiggyBac transposable element-derived protein 2 [Trichinella patagoniensis]|uniref:PiggyBac transposable element-derived protein 2 n=1 Tax=Trichinella patagoniensis TaxID=990121 RepID=A0A0V0ZBF1_9BILA|nr:PiggyBac transposable element-derived protein 2 [Trichinella patagoniensis]